MLVNCQLIPDEVLLSTQSHAISFPLKRYVLGLRAKNINLTEASVLFHCENRERGGLASPVRSQQPQHLVFFNTEGDSTHSWIAV